MNKVKCQVCGGENALVLIDFLSPTAYCLCSNHLLKLVTLSLEPNEYKKLVEIHTDKTFYLHDDFYDKAGNALQPKGR